MCWEAENPGRLPYQSLPGPVEVCCMCGTATDMGIYVRRDPATVYWPRTEADDD
jgi:hypothetical protein